MNVLLDSTWANELAVALVDTVLEDTLQGDIAQEDTLQEDTVAAVVVVHVVLLAESVQEDKYIIFSI